MNVSVVVLVTSSLLSFLTINNTKAYPSGMSQQLEHGVRHEVVGLNEEVFKKHAV